jgi:hypothetical protein
MPEITMEDLETQIAIMLRHFFVANRKVVLMKGVSVQFIVKDFGLIVCGINRLDYAQVNDKIEDNYPGWRTIYISSQDNLAEKKLEILWSLMRGGYMKWLRLTYPRQMRSVLMGPDNLGTRIIEERLRIWDDRPKFAYYIQDNRDVLRNGILREYTQDPGFFDYMPEEEV